MSQTDLARFRQRCGQFRWLAIFMVVSVGGLLALIHLVFPFIVLARGAPSDFGARFVASAVWWAPSVCYLFGVWSIGRAMGDLSKGRLFQPTVSDALRRVGLALGIGGVLSVFVMSNLMRLVGQSGGGYLHFDVPGMTLGMIGGALFLLGGVIEQAGKVQAELDEMI